MRNNGFIGVLFGAFIAILLIIGVRNSIVTTAEAVDKAAATIETQLQRRNDLIPNIVATAKGYASHEKEVFTQIAEARSQLAGAIESGKFEEMATADSELSQQLTRLMAIVESYPDLKANQTFIALQDELAGTENRINYARNQYNKAVAEYNKKIKMFPTSIFAKILGYEEREYFKATAGAENAPVVSFD